MDNIFFQLSADFFEVLFFIIRAFMPLIVGLIIAYLLNGPVDFICNKLNKDSAITILGQKPKGRGVAIIITYFIVFLVIVSVFYAFITLMLGALPTGKPSEILARVYEYISSLEITSKWFSKYLSTEYLIHIASSALEAILNLFLGIVASIYLLKDKEIFLRLWQQFLSVLLKQRIHGIVSEVLYDINTVITTFIKGAFVDSIIVALLSSVILSILNIRYAVIIGIIGGLLNVIPYFGPFFGMIPAFLMAFTNQGILKAILTIAALFAVQQLDSNYIYPKIVGSSTGLHPLFVLISVSVMGYFAGIVGMLIAVPLAGVIQVVVKKVFYSL